ncbi:class 1 fructose-bisphosphatase [Brevundimonas sp.]|uniref:class 1 fructose-bisphosphatase n=1 Tax=Brevundimonas sp. TaxID=1871086 RepID=UPI00391D6EDD
MTPPVSLQSYLDHFCNRPDVGDAIRDLASACAEISALIRLGMLDGHRGLAGRVNVQDEAQQKLDVISDEVIAKALTSSPSVAGFASEEREAIQTTGRTGGVLVVFDPLDGSSNIDVNVSVGTIFSIMDAPVSEVPNLAHFLRSGRHQLAAGYAVYGPQTELVLTITDAVVAFTLDAHGVWIQTQSNILVPVETRDFAINMSNQRHWSMTTQEYIGECLMGRDGPRGKDFNMRWVGSMVADVHRILMRGGVFLYPWDRREPTRPGKLRLLYEGAPMALLIERAGGSSTTGDRSILDVEPSSLHERVAVVLGSADEVQRLTSKCGETR